MGLPLGGELGLELGVGGMDGVLRQLAELVLLPLQHAEVTLGG